MNRIRKFAVLLVIMAFHSHLYAKNSQNENNKHSLYKGAYAVNFGLSGDLWNLSIDDYWGSTFSGKYHLANNRALRIGIELRGSVESRKTLEEKEAFTDYIRNRDQSTIDFSILINMIHLWYLRDNGNIHFKTGIGPSILLNRDQTDYEYQDKNLYDSTVNYNLDAKTSHQNYNLGIAGVAGVEAFIKSNLSLLFEFQSSLGYNFSKSTDEKKEYFENDLSFRNSDSKVKRLDFRPNQVKLGLTFYF